MNVKKNEIIIPENVQQNWQKIIDLLAKLSKVPAALIMRLNPPEIEVFIASSNSDNPYHPGDSEHFDNSGLYCETVIKTRKKLLVPDALADDNWKNNPDIKLNMIAYLGFPIFLPDGKPFGTICILDNKKNEYSQPIEQLMLEFKTIIEANIELIYLNQYLEDKNELLVDYFNEIEALRGLVPVCSHCKAIRDKDNQWHSLEYYLVKQEETMVTHGICPDCVKKYYSDFDDPKT
ncbi:MAG: GAF domain-containing protein [Myxococcota bacterium]